MHKKYLCGFIQPIRIEEKTLDLATLTRTLTQQSVNKNKACGGVTRTARACGLFFSSVLYLHTPHARAAAALE